MPKCKGCERKRIECGESRGDKRSRRFAVAVAYGVFVDGQKTPDNVSVVKLVPSWGVRIAMLERCGRTLRRGLGHTVEKAAPF